MSPRRKRDNLKEPSNSSSSSGRKDGLLTRAVSYIKRKGNYRPGEDVQEEMGAELTRQDTLPEEDIRQLIPENASNSSVGSQSMIASQAESCYSNQGGNTIDDLLARPDLEQLIESAEAPSEPPPSAETADSLPSESSLGKRKASDLSEFSAAAPSFTRPRLEGPAPEEDPVFILSTGVQWEIARYMSLKGELASVSPQMFQKLLGNNATAAPLVMRTLLEHTNNEKEKGEVKGKGKEKSKGGDDADEVFRAAFAKELSAKSPWEELDKEENALRADPYAGLGFSDAEPDYFGGKVIFSGRLKNNGTRAAPEFSVVLDAPGLGPSCRFLRRFGSWNFMKVKVTKACQQDSGLVEFFSRPFVINGKVFRAFYAKDSNVFMLRTNECVGSGLSIFTGKPGHCGPMSLRTYCSRKHTNIVDFLNWHNPFDRSPNQAIQKWATRFSLGLSTSVPGLRLKPENIRVIPDIVSPEPHNSDMTDGCGFLNRSALLALLHKFPDWHDFPSAIQCRLKGAKGMLCEDPDHISNKSEEYIAHIRPSQIKVNYPSSIPLDPAMCIIDLLQASHMRTPARLNGETIINFAENGVPHSVFKTLFSEGLKAEVAPFNQWEGKDAMFDLWCHVARVGGVMAARAARESAAEAKVKGYRVREPEDEEDEDDLADADLVQERSTAWWGDEVSGLPSSLEETCMYLLDPGFTPTNSAVLRDKLSAVASKSIETYTSKFRIDVPMSCSALLIPDPYGVLEENEIQVKSSSREFVTPDGMKTDIILGDVLLARNPCKLPTDARKVQAVYRPELANYTNVIVCSVKGYRRLADFLAGGALGDYDGDKGIIFWDPIIVEPFENADEKFSYEPEEAKKDFTRHTETVAQVMREVEGEHPLVQTRKYQTYLLGTLQDTAIVGIYSFFHDYATYTLGYKHPETIRLNYMFCTLLDRFKNGRILMDGVLAKDQKAYGKRNPLWKESNDAAMNIVDNTLPPKRPHFLHTFIMDEIRQQAEVEAKTQNRLIKNLFQHYDRVIVDPDLTAPWILEQARVEFAKENAIDTRQVEAELEAIRVHVQGSYARYQERKARVLKENGSKLNSSKLRKRTRDNRPLDFTALPIEIRQDVLRAGAKDFAAGPSMIFIKSPEDVTRLRASYAYIYDSEQAGNSKWSRFPWDVCARDLCDIKARALGVTKTCTQDFYTRFTMKHSSFKRRH
ncbi:hypothetical protein HWV62_14138 [Athelia sp. TMB]|nr:hypothetical protein HWV62_14138 [Athelia sp. TMB]